MPRTPHRLARVKAILRSRNGRHLTIQATTRPSPAPPALPVPLVQSPVPGHPQPVSRSAASLQLVRAAGLAAVVRTASEHAAGDVQVGRVLPVRPELRGLLPGGGLRRGALVGVAAAQTAAPTSLMLALLAAASQAGSWCGVVGVPTLGAVAAAELGLALDRLALVPHPGAEWATVVAALLDGLDIVVAAPPGPVSPEVANRLAARARQHGSVLVAYGPWRGADVMLEAVRGVWEGLGNGRGRLRARELTIRSVGRGAAAAPRQTSFWLPGPPPETANVVTRPNFGKDPASRDDRNDNVSEVQVPLQAAG